MRLAVLNEEPTIKTLKDNTVKLSDDERTKVMDAKAVWHFGSNGKPSPAVKKSTVRGKTYYWSATHRCYAIATTLIKAIKDFFDTVEPSS